MPKQTAAAPNIRETKCETHSGCHGLVPWRFTFRAESRAVTKNIKRETPRRKARECRGFSCSTKRETPRLKVVASQGVAQLFF